LSERVDYGWVIEFKLAALRRAGDVFLSSDSGELKAFEEFCDSNAHWLDDYALFMACKDAHKGAVWTSWDAAIRQRTAEGLKAWNSTLAGQVRVLKYWQFEFFRQWEKLKSHAHERGVSVMGDVPIYVAHDSADVWSHPDLFQLKANGEPTVVAGVPPDYFSATGQLWGNPIYRWDVLAASGYRWWIERLQASFKMFDSVRLDHFRGFEAYWEVPAGAATAIGGKWIKAPGAELFRAVQAALGELPIVAENLGVLTPEVEAIRKEFGFPGMAILQFAFGNDPQGPSFRPHNYERQLAAYTGVHDNDTTVGWWTSSGAGDSTRTAEDIRKERAFAKAYLGFEDEPIQWVFIRTLLASVADIAVIPLQDVLGLGNEARMNLPGTIGANWKWRFGNGALTADLCQRLKTLAQMYDR
jgi:4-alpha-glucanotransferase